MQAQDIVASLHKEPTGAPRTPAPASHEPELEPARVNDDEASSRVPDSTSLAALPALAQHVTRLSDEGYLYVEDLRGSPPAELVQLGFSAAEASGTI